MCTSSLRLLQLLLLLLLLTCCKEPQQQPWHRGSVTSVGRERGGHYRHPPSRTVPARVWIVSLEVQALGAV